MDPITIRRIEIRKLNPDYNEFLQTITYVKDDAPTELLRGTTDSVPAADTIDAVETWATEEGLDLG